MSKTLKNKKGGIFINTLDQTTDPKTSIKDRFTNFIEDITTVEDITEKIRVTPPDEEKGIEYDLIKGKYYKIVNDKNDDFKHTELTLFNRPVKELILKLVVIDDSISDKFIKKDKSIIQNYIENIKNTRLTLNEKSRESENFRMDDKFRKEREKIVEKYKNDELTLAIEMSKLIEKQENEKKNGNNEIVETLQKELKEEYNEILQKEKERKEKEDEGNIDYFMKNRKFSSTKFNNCVEIQKDIFLKTVTYLQPICPAIIYSEILENEDYTDYLNKIFKNSMNNENEKIIEYLDHNNFKLGIIAMENYENYENYFILKDRIQENKEYYINLLRYIYLSLFKLGYVDPFFDANSIIINDDYSYFFSKIKKRPLLIDFTNIEKITDKDNKIINKNIEKKKYFAVFEYYCDVITDNKFSSWVCGDSKDQEIEVPDFYHKLDKVLTDENKKNHKEDNVLTDKNKKIHKEDKVLTDENKKIRKEDNKILEKLFEQRIKQIEKNILEIKKHKILNTTYPLQNTFINKYYGYMLPDNENRYQGGRKNKKTQKNKKTRNTSKISKRRKTRKYRI